MMQTDVICKKCGARDIRYSGSGWATDPHPIETVYVESQPWCLCKYARTPEKVDERPAASA